MKLVYVALSFNVGNKKIGGGEISNRELLSEISKKEQVVVLSLSGGTGWGTTYNNIEIYDFSSLLKSFLYFNILVKFLAPLLFKYIVKSFLKNSRPDIVLGATESVGMVAKFGREYKIPCGAFVRAFENFNHKKNFKQFVKKNLYLDYSEVALSNLDFLIANSQFMKNKCTKVFNGNVYVVYPTIELERDAVKELGMIKTIGMVSTKEGKGYLLFKELAKKYPEIEFIVLGATEQEVQMNEIENIKLYSWTKKPEVVLRKMDIILVPSLVEETFGRVSIEALRLGKRVIVSDKGGLPETVNFRNEIIAKNGNFNSWKEKVDIIVDNPNIYNDILSDLSEESAKFSLDCQASKLTEILNSYKK